MKRSAILLLVTAAFLSASTTLTSQTIYTWVGGSSGSWTTPGNWSSPRDTPALTDILVVSSSASITDVPTETIGELRITGTATVSLSSSPDVMLTIGSVTVNPSAHLIVGTAMTVICSDRFYLYGVVSGNDASTSVLDMTGGTYFIPADTGDGGAISHLKVSVGLPSFGTVYLSGLCNLQSGASIEIDNLSTLKLESSATVMGGALIVKNSAQIDVFGSTLTLNGVALNLITSGNVRDNEGGGRVITDGNTTIDHAGGNFQADLQVNSGTTTASGTQDFDGDIDVMSGATLTVPLNKFLRTEGAVTVEAEGGGIDGAGTLYYRSYSPFTNNGTVSVKTVFESFVEGYSYIAGIGTWANLTIASGAYLNMSSDVTIKNFNLTIDGDLNTQSNVLTLDGTTPSTLTVNETGSVYGGSSTVKTQGTVNVIQNGTFDETLEVLGGTTTIRGVFNNLQIDNTAGVNLSGATTVNGALNVVGGNLTTGSNTLTLGPSATISETSPYAVLGTLYTSRACSTQTSQSFGNLGIELAKSSGTFGFDISVTRVTGTASSIPGALSIKRYFDIAVSPSDSNHDIGATLYFHYSPTSESNGTTESNLHLYRSTNSGSTWSDMGGNVDTELHKITLAGVNSFSRWTAGQIASSPPTLTSISPRAAGVGENLTVTLTGTNFVNGASNVSFSGSGITVSSVTFNSSTQITASITIASSAARGSRNVSVTTPGGTATLPSAFEVQNPLPTLTDVSPSSGGRGQTIGVTLRGSDFAGQRTSVSFGGGITVSSVGGSATTLTAQIKIASSASLGPRDVSVTNPSPGGGSSSLSSAFSVVNPTPTITGVSPNGGARGQVLRVVIGGTNLLPGVTSLSFGGGITADSIIFLSNTQVQTRLSISPTASFGSIDVSVTNAGPGGGTATLAGAFTITNPAPKTTGINPTVGGKGKTISVTIAGADFLAGGTTVSAGAGVSVGSVVVASSTQLSATFTIARDASLGARDVTVTNPVPGGGSSTLAAAFSVQYPSPTVLSVSPAAGVLGQTLSVIVAGSDLFTGVSTLSFGTGITVNSMSIDSSGTHIAASITIASGVALGAREITVSNLGPGGGAMTLSNAFTVGNPVPTLVSVNPLSGNKGQTFNIVLTGSNFVSGSSNVSFGPGVTVNSVVINNPTSMTASVTITPDAVAAARSVVVTNPPPGGGTATLPFAFNVQNAAPTLSSVSPGSGTRSQMLNLTLSGTGFYSGVTTVSFGPGITVSSSVVNSLTQMTIGVTVASDAAMGSRDIVVNNTAPGGGTATLAGSFTVSYPVPTLTSLSLNSGIRSQTLNVTLAGSGFYSGVTSVSFGAGITVNSTVVNSLTQMTIGISVASDAAMGPRDVAVTNPAPGGGTATLAGSFTVANPVPTIASVTPVSAGRGSLLKVTVVGTQFIDGVTSLSFGVDVSVTSFLVKSPTEIQVNIAINPAATPGTRTVTVTNAAPGGGSASLTNAFTISSAPATSIEGELGVIPEEYVLQEAYPNPFNPSTRVRYGVPENSRIRLIVHNMLGNVVAELASGERSKGMYELQWHADNLPSGVYLVRMNAESLESTKRFIASRKVVLVK